MGKAPRGRVSLTFSAYGGLTRPFIGKSFFSTRRPVPETGGQRPTALCALGREIVWTIVLAPCARTTMVVIIRERGG